MIYQHQQTVEWLPQFAKFRKHFMLKSNCIKDLWHFDRVSAYFSDASQNFICIRYHWFLFE